MKQAFCLNSKRWIVFMDLRVVYPNTCPWDGQCAEHDCGYFEEREQTAYLKRKLKKLSEVS